MKREIETQAVGSSSAFSQAVEVNGTVYVSGQIHADANWKLVGDTVTEKLAAIFDNIAAILDVVDMAVDDIVKATVYVTDMSQLEELNREYPKYFRSATLPAREAVCVKELPLGATIEISVIASR
ncbi:MAG TPA: RidA family protein [Patescibacteria group bacterium]|nr:RidA family protein [Patescibacteria group bacterium]